ncbi:MAG: divalent metal cation transporter, partial [Pseudomonadota bacterium]
LYVLSELPVIVIILAATATVTAAILTAVSGLALPLAATSVGLIAVAGVMLRVGGYGLLERLTKVFVAILTLATLTATVLSLPRIDWSPAAWAPPAMDPATLAFVVALMGFMPSAINLSVLQSLWAMRRRQRDGEHASASAALLDFNVGYIGSGVLAICFVLMGAGVMHASGEAPAASAGVFAGQIIGLFTTTIGDWAGLVVGVAALLVMFTTLMTVLDGFPRMLATAFAVLRDGPDAGDAGRASRLTLCMGLYGVAASIVLLFLMGSFRDFIDFVTITAFVVGPIAATLNHLAMCASHVPAASRPPRWLQAWSIAGIVAMLVLTAVFFGGRTG